MSRLVPKQTPLGQILVLEDPPLVEIVVHDADTHEPLVTTDDPFNESNALLAEMRDACRAAIAWVTARRGGPIDREHAQHRAELDHLLDRADDMVHSMFDEYQTLIDQRRADTGRTATTVIVSEESTHE